MRSYHDPALHGRALAGPGTGKSFMDAEVSTHIGAELYERSDSRTAHRNGYRTRI